MVSAGARITRVEPPAFNLNEALHAPAVSDRDISMRFDLASDLPPVAASEQTIRNVVDAVLDYARTEIQRTSRPGVISIRTESKSGCVVFSTTYWTNGGPHQLVLADGGGCVDSEALTACAEVVRDECGEIYVWRPRTLDRVTITVELPVR